MVINSESDIYQLTQEWIFKTRGKCSRKIFDDYREKFGLLERAVFGDVSERVKNPVAMKYDLIRNGLVRYIGDKNPENLDLAVKDFLELKNPNQ